MAFWGQYESWDSDTTQYDCRLFGVASKLIREFAKTTPIVALTANAFDSDRCSVLEVGCIALAVKSIMR